MSYQVLARKWRPRDFSQMVGQEHLTRALRNALDSQRLHHAYLFAGTRGVGKTTVARIFAKCLNCEQGIGATPCGTCSACTGIDQGRFIDLMEVDAASRAKVDETRELMDNVQFVPAQGRFKVYLIDEVHMFSNHSFNALLKTLEEPPPHVKFLLATTDPQKLPVTVLSRCLQFNLRRLSREEISKHLSYILREEDISADADAVTLIAASADGSMRDALSLLDQAIAHGGGRVSVEDVRAMVGAVDRTYIHELLSALCVGDGPALMDCVARMTEQAVDFAAALDELVSTLHRIAVIQVSQVAHGDSVDDVQPFAERISAEDVQLNYQIGVMGRRDLPWAPDPRSGFEMTLLRMLAFKPATVNTPAPAPAPAPAASTVQIAPRQQAVSKAKSRRQTNTGDSPATTSAQPSPSTSNPCAPLTADNWRTTIDAMALVGLTRELANNSELTGFDGKTVKLRIAQAKSQLTVSSVLERLQFALSSQLNTDIKIDVSVGAPQSETPAQAQQREQSIRQQQAVETLERDPNVRAIRESFGAVIDPSSIQPLDG